MAYCSFDAKGLVQYDNALWRPERDMLLVFYLYPFFRTNLQDDDDAATESVRASQQYMVYME